MRSPLIRFLVVYVAMSAFLAGFALLELWPWRPQTAASWVALFFLALPLAAAGEWLGQLLLENRFAKSLGSSTAANSLSWARVAYGVAAMIVMCALVVAIVFAASSLMEAIHD